MIPEGTGTSLNIQHFVIQRDCCGKTDGLCILSIDALWAIWQVFKLLAWKSSMSRFAQSGASGTNINQSLVTGYSGNLSIKRPSCMRGSNRHANAATLNRNTHPSPYWQHWQSSSWSLHRSRCLFPAIPSGSDRTKRSSFPDTSLCWSPDCCRRVCGAARRPTVRNKRQKIKSNYMNSPFAEEKVVFLY